MILMQRVFVAGRLSGIDGWDAAEKTQFQAPPCGFYLGIESHTEHQSS